MVNVIGVLVLVAAFGLVYWGYRVWRSLDSQEGYEEWVDRQW